MPPGRQSLMAGREGREDELGVDTAPLPVARDRSNVLPAFSV